MTRDEHGAAPANACRRPVPSAAAALTVVVLVVGTATAVATLAWSGSVPNPVPESVDSSVLAEARGWSAATLFVAIPLGVAALRAALRGSLRARLCWLGVLANLVHTYLERAVSPPFTALHLPYVAAFACAVPALVMGVASIDIAELPAAFGDRYPRRFVAVFSVVVASLLAAAWLKDIGARTLAGSFGWPAGPDAIRHVVRALDLGLQVPLGIATGVMLFRRAPAGLLLAAMMLVNAVCMGAALTGMVCFSTSAAGTSAWSVAPFAVLWAVATTAAVRFFRSGVHSRASYERVAGAWGAPCTD